MRTSSIRNYESGLLVGEGMKEILEKERMNSQRWQQVKQNQESNFMKDLNKF